MKETTKQARKNLKNFVFNSCVYMASDYNMQEPKSWADCKKMIKSIFEAEKGFEIGRLGTKQAFYNWVMGLCFISPIMEDLTPFTTYSKTELEKEQEVTKILYILTGVAK